MLIIYILLGIAISQQIKNVLYDEDSHLQQIINIEDDHSALIYLQSLGKEASIGRKVLSHSICKGWNMTATFLITRYNEEQIDLYQTFSDARTCINRSQLSFLNNLTLLLPEDSPVVNIVEPCYLWAQNMTHVFLKIKFSSKIDVPGALEILRLNITITMPEFYLNAYSFQGTPTRYILRIKTYKFMNPNHYRYYYAELGQIVLEILKSPAPYFWRNIHSDWYYNPPNQYFWWDMYYQYKDQLKDAFGLIDDAENRREDMEQQKYDEEEELIKGRRLWQKRLEDEHKIIKKEIEFQKTCRLSKDGRKCRVLDPNEWSSWL